MKILRGTFGKCLIILKFLKNFYDKILGKFKICFRKIIINFGGKKKLGESYENSSSILKKFFKKFQ